MIQRFFLRDQVIWANYIGTVTRVAKNEETGVCTYSVNFGAIHATIDPQKNYMMRLHRRASRDY